MKTLLSALSMLFLCVGITAGEMPDKAWFQEQCAKLHTSPADIRNCVNNGAAAFRHEAAYRAKHGTGSGGKGAYHVGSAVSVHGYVSTCCENCKYQEGSVLLCCMFCKM